MASEQNGRVQSHAAAVNSHLQALESCHGRPLSDIRLDTIAALATATLKSIIELFGERAATGIMSRGCRPVGNKDGRALTRTFRPKGSTMRRIGYLTDLVAEMSEITYATPERYENFFKSINYSCPYADQFGAYGPEIAHIVCTVCEQYCQGITDSVAEGYTCTISQKLAAGDPICEFTYVKDGTDEKGEELEPYAMPPLRLKLLSATARKNMKEEYVAHLLIHTIIAMSTVSDFKPILLMASRATLPVGTTNGGRIASCASLVHGAPDAALELLGTSLAMLRTKYELGPCTDDELHLAVTSCIFGKTIYNDVDEASIPEDVKQDMRFTICELCRLYHQGVLTEAFPAYDLEIPRRISTGERSCEFILKKQGGGT